MNAKSGANGFDASIYGDADEKNQFLDYIPDEATANTGDD
jgi:hypothetical protein